MYHYLFMIIFVSQKGVSCFPNIISMLHQKFENFMWKIVECTCTINLSRRYRGLDNVQHAGCSVDCSNKLYCEDVELRFNCLATKYSGVVPSLVPHSGSIRYSRGSSRSTESQHGLIFPHSLRFSALKSVLLVNYLNLTCPFPIFPVIFP